MKKFYRILDKGSVSLENNMSNDLNVVNSARASFNKRSKKLRWKDEKLINYLLKNRHGVPFESSVFTFRIKLPIFIARQLQKHRISSQNEQSGRYSKLIEQFYVPNIKNVRTQYGKAGSYTYSRASEKLAKAFKEDVLKNSQSSYKLYQKYLTAGVSKELARIVLPLNMYTVIVLTINARSLMNLLNLRNHKTAQAEIVAYAKVLEEIFAELMPITYKSFIANGRVAP